jgi:ATP-dependent Clp protease ATP-binding subunit ClpC
MYERFTDGARSALSLANRESQRWNHGELQPTHILLGLLAQSGWGIARLIEIGGGKQRVRDKIEETFKHGTKRSWWRRLKFTTTAKQVVEMAVMEARAMQQSLIPADLLLFAVLKQPTPEIATAFTSLQIDPLLLGDQIHERLQLPSAEP